MKAGRRPLMSHGRATAIWWQLARRLKREPTIAEFTIGLGATSTRTGVSYKRLINRGVCCRACGGVGKVHR